jgi:hypothetical protein
MRFTLSLLSTALLFTSCAYNGVIVQKISRPHPLYESVGIEGVFAFVVRDSSGGLHRQMVTPEVFEAYNEGQYFNDLQPPQSAAPAQVKATVAATAAVPEQTKHVASHTKRSAPARHIDAPPPVESTQSFKASEMERSSRSMTATLRTEVHQDAPETNNETGHAVEPAAAGEKGASEAKEKKSATKSEHSSKAKSSENKSAKPWKLSDPTIQTEPAPPSEGPSASPAPNASPDADETGRLRIPPQP